MTEETENKSDTFWNVVGSIVIFAIVGGLCVYGAFFYVPPEPAPTPTAIITITDRVWDGDSSHWGYVTTSWGDVYRVQNPEDYMRMRLNHTYNVDMDFVTMRYPFITKMNYEVMP
jgi:hypothetical protein